ncbi:hypothetical protein CXB51_004740 [Gossypium anomalum]|uniref:Reverse transcriptase domain-containing protein n=1 Tax=Gossypium anomalum TaxID=47600 RepID=A0A8J5ZHU8_9ROSI|nr:hypothetical protein CXB51_004740 [Gossypium anomalum]
MGSRGVLIMSFLRNHSTKHFSKLYTVEAYEIGDFLAKGVSQGLDRNCLKCLLLRLNQSSFIAPRNILDNIIVAQEAIHTMKNAKSKKRWMAVKLDLEKAYD